MQRNIMPEEVKQTVNLYLGGKIDQWFVRQDGQGVVFLMNVTSVEESAGVCSKKAAAGRRRADGVRPDASGTSEPAAVPDDQGAPASAAKP